MMERCPGASVRCRQQKGRGLAARALINRVNQMLLKLQVHSASAPFPAGFEVVGNLLVVGDAGQAGALNSGDVNEHVLAAALGCDEAEAFGCVEPFHGASGHFRVS